MDGVQVDHRREEHIATPLLREKPRDVVLHRHVLATPAAMHSPFLPGVSDKHWRMQVYAAISQLRLEHVVGKRQLGWPFGEEVEARHQCGPPPMTFFSQTSPRLYSSSHASSPAASGRVNCDAFPSRLTTI